MGWTGMFNWDFSEKNSEILKRELFGRETRYEPLKWADKGGHTWLLYRHIETGKTYAAVILCQRSKKDHEFCYKEIGLSSGPCHCDMPKSWLPLIKDTYKDDKYAQDWFKRYEEENSSKKAKQKFEIGDYVKCVANCGISWGSGYEIKADEVFYIHIEALNPFASKKTKAYIICNPRWNMATCGRRIKGTSFNNLKSAVKLSKDDVESICKEEQEKALKKSREGIA